MKKTFTVKFDIATNPETDECRLLPSERDLIEDDKAAEFMEKDAQKLEVSDDSAALERATMMRAVVSEMRSMTGKRRDYRVSHLPFAQTHTYEIKVPTVLELAQAREQARHIDPDTFECHLDNAKLAELLFKTCYIEGAHPYAEIPALLLPILEQRTFKSVFPDETLLPF